MDCAYCKLKEMDEAKIFEDEDIIIAVNPFPIVEGEIIVFTKKHYTILEEIPDSLIEKMGFYSKYFSMILFESLKCEGTNIYAENGNSAGQLIPHFSISLIPRWKDDNVNFSWIPKQIPKDSIDNSLKVLKENLVFEKTIVESKNEISEGKNKIIEEETKKTEKKGIEKNNEKQKEENNKENEEEIDYRYENYFNRQP